MSIDLSRLSDPFAPDKIHWRIGATTQNKDKGMALAYIDARDVMERLDEVCGPEGWQRRYVDAGNGRTCCEVGVNIYAGEHNLTDNSHVQIVEQWVWKSDGAGDTDVEGDKGAFSDAFKRAAVNWGIGRYLYDLPNVWVDIEQRGRTSIIKDNQYAKLQSSLANSPTQKPSQRDAPLKADRPCSDEYVETAIDTIAKLKAANGVRTWWKNEAPQRAKNGLSQAQIDRLQAAAAKRTEELEGAKAA